MGDGTVVWLSEAPDPDDCFYASGRFSGYVDIGGPGGEQLVDATLEEALSWAQERAEVVLLRLYGAGYFSAGARHADPATPVWDRDAVVVRRRVPGLEMLDNTERDPPVLWDLRLYPPPGLDEDSFAACVRGDDRVEPAPADARRPTDPGVRVFVRASTLAQAEAIAAELDTRACDQAPGDVPSGGWWKRGPAVYPHAPDASIGFG